MKISEIMEEIKTMEVVRDVTPKRLHDWEEFGLLGIVPRTEGGHRDYSDVNLMRFKLICILRTYAWTLKNIKKLLNGDIDLRMKLHEILIKAKITIIPFLEYIVSSDETFERIKLPIIEEKVNEAITDN